MSNVRPQSPCMAEHAHSPCTARALAPIQMPQVLCLPLSLQPAGGRAPFRLGCPSFGGHRTLIAARTKCAPSRARHRTCSEQELKIARSMKESTGVAEYSATLPRASFISGKAAVHQESAAPVPSRAILTVSKFGTRSASVSSPVRSNLAVKRTPKSYAFVCRLPLR
jgi:hypothetical protein